jgi:hypothetical protein
MESLARVKSLRRKARRKSDPDWTGDPDVRWLKNHRIVAGLAIRRELSRHPEGPPLRAVLYLVRSVGPRGTTEMLPDLLLSAKNTADRLAIVSLMADLRDPVLLDALQKLLSNRSPNLSQRVICEAARGLGLSGRKKYLPILRKAQNRVSSDSGRLQVSGACYRCGAEEMVRPLIEALAGKKTPIETRLWALKFFARDPHEDAIPVMARLCAEAPSPDLADYAYEQLVEATGYAPPPPAPGREENQEKNAMPERPVSPEDLQTETEDQTQRKWERTKLSELEPEERREQIRRVIGWWKNNRGASTEENRDGVLRH